MFLIFLAFRKIKKIKNVFDFAFFNKNPKHQKQEKKSIKSRVLQQGGSGLQPGLQAGGTQDPGEEGFRRQDGSRIFCFLSYFFSKKQKNQKNPGCSRRETTRRHVARF